MHKLIFISVVFLTTYIKLTFSSNTSKHYFDKYYSPELAKTKQTAPLPEGYEEAKENYCYTNIRFTAEFNYQLYKKYPNQTSLISTFKLLFLLGPLALTSTGAKHDQLIKAIGLKNRDKIRKVYPAVADEITTDSKDVKIKYFAKISSDVKYTYEEEFEHDFQKIFSGTAGHISFSDSGATARRMNCWVQEKVFLSCHKSEKISPDQIPEGNTILMMAGIDFQGLKWKYPVNSEESFYADFYLNKDDTFTRRYMVLRGLFEYDDIEELDAKFIRMPYKDDRYAYVAIVPNKKDGLPKLMEKLRDPKLLNKTLIEEKPLRCLKVYLPAGQACRRVDYYELLNDTHILKTKLDNFDDIFENEDSTTVSTILGTVGFKADEGTNCFEYPDEEKCSKNNMKKVNINRSYLLVITAESRGPILSGPVIRV